MLMKRRDILNKLKAQAKADGVDYAETEGGSHTKVSFSDGRQTVVPRHKEVNERTAKAILKQMGA